VNVVIVGNGVAGVTAARIVRDRAPDARISIYTREPHHYYYRPRLPEVVAGELGLKDILANPPEWYASRRIDVHLSSPVTSVDVPGRRILLGDGSVVPFDRLLVASGSDAFVPPVEGARTPGAFALRTADDAVAIHEWAGRSSRAVVVGCGLLGLESARGLRASGLDVTVLENSGRLLPRQLDERGGAVLERLVSALGIRITKHAKTTAVRGGERVTGVALEDGTTLPADLVLFATGVRSASGFLSESGIKIDHGVVVDCDMRTSVPDVFAAGDVAEFNGRSWGIVPVALAQADAAGRSITGDTGPKRCDVVPSATLKITGVDVFSAGVQSCPDPGCEEFVEEDPDGRRYRKIVTREGRIIGAIVIGSRKGVREIGAMIEKGTPVGRHAGSIAREDFDYAGALKSV
jgi:nitrite reductase (NADH) large subunit